VRILFREGSFPQLILPSFGRIIDLLLVTIIIAVITVDSSVLDVLEQGVNIKWDIK
jgi:hypothetical protein